MPTPTDASSSPTPARGEQPSRNQGVQALQVVHKDVLADEVVRLRLERPAGGRLPDWAPGAHIDIVVPSANGESLVRHYSLCGDRWEADAYEIAILRDPASRGGSQFIHDELEVGDILEVGTPRNNFDLWPATRYQFIAGGIGITPIMTMIAAAEALGRDWHLLYGGRTRSSMAFLDELAQFGDRVTVWPQDEEGLLDLSGLAEPVDGGKVYCCGPEPLLTAVGEATSAWPSHAVRFERFMPAVQPTPVRSEPFSVELAQSGRTVTVDTEETVLDALSAAGVAVLSSCGEGICGTCEVSVLDGVPDHRDSLLDDAERAKGDRMFVCVSRSVSDRLVLDI